MVKTSDDGDGDMIGTRDESINIVSWTEKAWLKHKKTGTIQGKILFFGDIKGTDKLIPVVDVKFDDCGVKYGWAGNQAELYVEPEALTSRESYDELLRKLANLPVPSFLKATKENIVATGSDKPTLDEATKEESGDRRNLPTFINAGTKVLGSGAEAIGKVRSQVAAKSDEIFRNKSLMRRQMLFYGVVSLYNDGLESFMNQRVY